MTDWVRTIDGQSEVLWTPSPERVAACRMSEFQRWLAATRNVKTTGSCVVHGRSDSTMHRGGVRMGSADIYAAVEALPEVAASLVIEAELTDGGYYMPLFVVLEPGQVLVEEVRGRIRKVIRDNVSPRHVQNDVVQVPGAPATRTGKRLEVRIKEIVHGVPVDKRSTAPPSSISTFWSGTSTSAFDSASPWTATAIKAEGGSGKTGSPGRVTDYE